MTTSTAMPLSRVSPAAFAVMSPADRDTYLTGLLDLHRSVWGEARMEETGGDAGNDGAASGATTEGTAAEGTSTEAAAGGTATGTAEAAKPNGDPQAGLTALLASLTEADRATAQAHIDAIVGREKAKAKTAAERAAAAQLEQVRTEAGQTEVEVAQSRQAAAVRDLTEARRENAALKVQIAMAGVVSPEHIEAAQRLADLPEVAEDGTVDADAIKAAVDAAVAKYPFLKVAEVKAPVEGQQVVGQVTAEPGSGTEDEPQTLADAIAAEMKKRA